MIRPLLLPLSGLLTVAAGLLLVPPAAANPPAPSFTIYGCIRSETGRPLDSAEGTVILSAKVKDSTTGVTSLTEITRGPIDTTLGRGINYTLQLSMDSGITVTPYKDATVVPDLPFEIKVVIGTETFVPLAISGQIFDAGKPAERERFDLVLGIDTDKDGLPDSWEMGLINANLNDNLKTLADVTKAGDADNDGISNYQEFLTGTYGLDASSGLFVDVIGIANSYAHLQFRAERGRTYSIRGSDDLKTWVNRQISTDPSGANPGDYFQAPYAAYIDVYVPVDTSKPAHFYKLDVE